MKFSFYKQYDRSDCGPVCLRMIAKYWGRNLSLNTLRSVSGLERDGVTLSNLSKGANEIGFETLSCKITLDGLNRAELPCILHWKTNHFIILYKIKSNHFFVADPTQGLLKLTEKDFSELWLKNNQHNQGIALFLKPTPLFFEQPETKDKINWKFITEYLIRYKKLFIQLILGLFVGSMIQLIFPFLTQSVIDEGITTGNINFIYLAIIAQAVLIIGRSSINFIRSWLLLHISTRINITILTDFLIKLMALPISFFDAKKTGDILQRTSDQRRIENFLTGSMLTTIFSVFNLLVFSVVMILYNLQIFGIFIVGNILYTFWVISFFKHRRTLDYQLFDISATNQSKMLQLINGMQEIKLNNCESEKRWEWESLQAKTFKFSIKNLALNQYQQGGSILINESTSLLISFLSAQAVIHNNLTLGSMVAIQYIIGQLNMPIQQFISFSQSFQDAKISLERLNEIFELEDEQPSYLKFVDNLPINKTIFLKNITFRYNGINSAPIFKGLSLTIPHGKTTAIVGMSGSGKTTLLKLLMRFYNINEGEIFVGDKELITIDYRLWRASCGVVMQDGFIFSDSIEKNIAVGDQVPDQERLKYAIKVSNIEELVSTLPLGLATLIGGEGKGISHGQKQRILIARAIYKNPEYVFLDEATNSLDTQNERIIMDNLQSFFIGKTVVIVAHRLSTVKNADNIIVLDKGIIAEQGTHTKLVKARGIYHSLIKNQLELES